ncbi:MAG TPA: UDP-N-acetylmuramate dehydrogenase [Coriobacteriia bacterium]|nr:UDP-N-acetylmuramate dehydrogenase [Coriobacteriia bacterium]
MTVTRVCERLSAQMRGPVRMYEPLGRHTTYRIGGPASIFAVCESVGDISRCLETLADAGMAWTVLGKGSNVLVSDDGYDGAVIVLGKEFKRHRTEDARVHSGAGVTLAAVVQDAYSRGLSGLEFAVGIPGTVGGCLGMNAGSRDEWISSRVETVTLYEPGRGLTVLRGPEVMWGYRTSGLPEHGVIIECSLALAQGERDRIRRTMEARFRVRKSSQPVGMPSAGSVFVNPADDSAGRLIEACGLKGMRHGGAQVSEVHANFIVNAGGATARDVIALIRAVREEVRERHGIWLETELRFLGTTP